MKPSRLPLVFITLVLMSHGLDLQAATQSTRPVTTRPTPKGGGWPTTLPTDAGAVWDRFIKAVDQHNWDRALSCLSRRSCSRASRDGPEDYYRMFVPIEQLKGEHKYHISTYGSDRGEDVFFGCWVNLSKTTDGTPVNWEWWLEKQPHGWVIDLPDVPVERWAEEEIARQKRIKDKSDAKWKALEPKLEGLRTQLTGLNKEYRVGQSLLFRLELFNTGQHDLTYDRQQVDVNGSMTITHNHREPVRFIGLPTQTGGWDAPIKAGETKILFDSFDIAQQYDMSKPGKYRVQFDGGGLNVGDGHTAARRLFPSNVVEIDLKP